MARAFELMRLHNLTGQYFPTNESMVWSSPTVQVCMYYAIRIQTPVAECSCPNGKAEASVKLPILLQHLFNEDPPRPRPAWSSVRTIRCLSLVDCGEARRCVTWVHHHLPGPANPSTMLILCLNYISCVVELEEDHEFVVAGCVTCTN